MNRDPMQPPPAPIPVLPYGIEVKSPHDRLYTILLAALAFFFLVGVITITSLPVRSPESRWVFRLVARVEVCYLSAIVATLIARIASPAIGRSFTTVLNIVMVVYFPLGTALAIYGFLKVDKQLRPLPRPAIGQQAETKDL